MRYLRPRNPDSKSSKNAATVFFSHHFLELILRLLDPFSIVAVHHKDETLGVLEVMAPQWSETEK
jgi:hypothetical protein